MTSDVHEITNLYGRYGELLNLGRIDELGELFRYGSIGVDGATERWQGTDEIASMYRESVHFGDKLPDTLLFTSNLQIEVDGDTAKGKAYFAALHAMEGAVVPVVAGRYHDEFRRIDGTWWFGHRLMFTDLIGDVSSHLRRPIEFDTE